MVRLTAKRSIRGLHRGIEGSFITNTSSPILVIGNTFGALYGPVVLTAV